MPDRFPLSTYLREYGEELLKLAVLAALLAFAWIATP